MGDELMKYWETLASGYDRFGGVQNVLLGVFAETESAAIGAASNNFLKNPDHLSLRAVDAYERSAEDLLQAYCQIAIVDDPGDDYLGNGEIGSAAIQWSGNNEIAVLAVIIKQNGMKTAAQELRSGSRSGSIPETIRQLFKLGMSVFTNG